MIPRDDRDAREGRRKVARVGLCILHGRGIVAAHMGEYELDHLIPLALGGHPRKLSNLQLQPWDGDDSATTKDGLERQLQRRVCDRKTKLVDAQYCIAENWQVCKAAVDRGHIISGGHVLESAPPVSRVDPPPQAAIPDPTSPPESVAPAAPPPASNCLIKGNISKRGKIYHLPGSASYDQTDIDVSQGERWFCTEAEARAAGWRAALR